ncbi:MAG: transposase [Caldilineaceae bacterium]|nr:transposase [Caldilineaceae bacterium]
MCVAPTPRQCLRECLRDGTDRAAPCQVQLDVDACFAPLLRWVLAWWQGSELTLAVDPTSKGEALVALVVSVVYRGLAIPVAWRIKTGGQAGPWMPDLCDLLDCLGSVVPPDMTVRVLCDRGLQSPRLWKAIRRQGWHPYMRYDRHMPFQAATGPRGPAWRFVAREGQYTVTAGKAFRARKRSCTLIVLWVPGQESPWVVPADEAPDDVDLGAYGLRVWIEQGFRTLKRMGWQWHRTRRVDPARVDRHWLVLAYGTRVEEARLRGLAPILSI